MTTTHSHRGIVWIDLESPSDEEISELVKRYSLHPLVGEELKSSPSQAKIDFYSDYILVVLTVPVRVRQGASYAIVDREIDFVVGKHFLITSRSETVEQLEYFSKIFEANAILNKDEKIDHAGHLFYYMVRRIYAGMCDDLQNIKDALTSVELHIFKGDEQAMVRSLSDISRELIDFKQTARVHHDIWEDMTAYSEKNQIFEKDFSSYIRAVRAEFEHIHELIGNARELLVDLRETNDSLLNTKQNQIIKVLTLMAFIFYPATFIASLFTIPASYVPLIGTSYGWTVILIGMVLVSLAIWWYFKKKRWV